MVEHYMYVASGNDSELAITVSRPFRPTYLITNVERECERAIEGLFVNNNHNELLQPVDAYFFSSALASLKRDEFLKAHDLIGKSSDFIDDYLDEHELSIPGYMRIDLPSLDSGDRLRITGNLSGVVVTLMGISY